MNLAELNKNLMPYLCKIKRTEMEGGWRELVRERGTEEGFENGRERAF